MTSLPSSVSDSCHARIGLMGNPSDGFKGKTVSFLLENFKATVHITEKPDDSRIELAEPVFFDSLDSLLSHTQKIVNMYHLKVAAFDTVLNVAIFAGLHKRDAIDASHMQSVH